MNNTPNDSKYYLKYGLHKDPFLSDSGDKTPFLTPDLRLRLKLAKQLIETDQTVLNITSSPGGGKTLFCKILSYHKGPDWVVSLITAKADMTPVILAHEIIRQFVSDYIVAASSSINQLHKYLEHAHNEKILPVIMIDNAHNLSFASLKFILELADIRYNDSLFRFVLFSNESINESFEEPRIKELANGILQNIHLPSFTQVQTLAYIEFCISSCGDEDVTDHLFSDDEINNIHKVSRGLPGGINLLARQIMAEKANNTVNQKKPRLLILISSIIIISVISLYYYTDFQSGDNDDSRIISLVTPPQRSSSTVNIEQQPEIKSATAEEQLKQAKQQVNQTRNQLVQLEEESKIANAQAHKNQNEAQELAKREQHNLSELRTELAKLEQSRIKVVEQTQQEQSKAEQQLKQVLQKAEQAQAELQQLEILKSESIAQAKKEQETLRDQVKLAQTQLEQIETELSQLEEKRSEADRQLKIELARATSTLVEKINNQAAQEEEIIQTISDWAERWSNQDVNGYLAFYSDGFASSKGLSKSRWAQQRQDRLSSPRFINVEIEQAKVAFYGNEQAQVSFYQKYESDTYKDRVKKTLLMNYTNDHWLIVEEKSN